LIFDFNFYFCCHKNIQNEKFTERIHSINPRPIGRGARHFDEVRMVFSTVNHKILTNHSQNREWFFF